MTKPLDELPGEFNAYCESLGLEEPESIAVLYDALKLYYERVLALAAKADSTRPEIRQAKAYIAQASRPCRC